MSAVAPADGARVGRAAGACVPRPHAPRRTPARPRHADRPRPGCREARPARPHARVAGRNGPQDRSHNFHPYAIRKRSPELVAAIGDAMRCSSRTRLAFYAEMYDGFSYADYASEVVRVGANSYRDPELAVALEKSGAEHVLFTGGGIVPAVGVRDPGDPADPRPHRLSPARARRRRTAVVAARARAHRGLGVLHDAGPRRRRRARRQGARTAQGRAAGREPRTTPTRSTARSFSFIDPLIRAELLVGDVLEAAGDLHSLPASPQDLSTRYHLSLHAPDRAEPRARRAVRRRRRRATGCGSAARCRAFARALPEVLRPGRARSLRCASRSTRAARRRRSGR